MSQQQQMEALEGTAQRSAVGRARMPIGASEAEARALAYCRDLTRQHAGSFYLGMRLTPAPKRAAMFALYALLRRCDDLADEADNADAAEVRARIERFRSTVDALFAQRRLEQAEAEDPIWPAIGYLVRQYPLRQELIHAMLDGQSRDAAGQRYASFHELYQYCYEVASTVGLLCVAIWGHDGKAETLKMAEHRGIALQLTNILRDVHEDALAGRVYLPSDDLARFGVSEADLRRGKAGDGFDALMAANISRARDYYERSADFEKHIAPDCRATSWAMMSTYRRLLERIARQPRRVLSERVRLGRLAKLSIAGRAVAGSFINDF